MISIRYFSYPGTTFTDHIFRYEDDPEAKVIVLLGEVCCRLFTVEERLNL